MRLDATNKYQVRRTCDTERKSEAECVHNFKSDGYTEFIYCGTCRTDGCNNNAKNAPITILIAAVSILTPFLSLFTS